ncbi:MAG: hypothetical protein ACRCZE_03060 [Candidatus Altimarinota bacterium]
MKKSTKKVIKKTAVVHKTAEQIKAEKHAHLRQILKGHVVKKKVVLKSGVAKELKPASGEFGDKYLSLLLEGKKAAKGELFGGGEVNLAKTPVILIFASELNGEKELINREELFKILEGCLVLNAKIVVVDTEQPSDLKNLSELQGNHDHQITWYNPKMDESGQGREEKELDRLLLAADMAVMFNHHLEMIHLMMNYGVVVIGDEKSPLLENYKPNEESGNAFVFPKKDAWGVFSAMVRAIETFKFPYDWKFIVKKVYK